jgi:predicted DNA-binding transcriptional regulator AlpA
LSSAALRLVAHLPPDPRPRATAPPAPSGETPAATLTLGMVRKFYLPLGERTLWRMISAGTFPRPCISLGSKTRLWRREVVEAWIAEQANG